MRTGTQSFAIQRSGERYFADHGWLKTYHSLSFADSGLALGSSGRRLSDEAAFGQPQRAHDRNQQQPAQLDGLRSPSIREER